MISRNSKTIHGKSRKGGKAKGIAQFKVYEKFEEILLLSEADLLMKWRTRVTQHGMVVQKALSHIWCGPILTVMSILAKKNRTRRV